MEMRCVILVVSIFGCMTVAITRSTPELEWIFLLQSICVAAIGAESWQRDIEFLVEF